MPSPMIDTRADTTKGKLFWAVITALVLMQIVAFWMLCSQQVAKAQVRDATLKVERTALADCLQYSPNATLSGCVSRVAPHRSALATVMAAGDKVAESGGMNRSAMNSTVPVSFVFR